MINMGEYYANEERYKDMLRDAEQRRRYRSTHKEHGIVRKSLGRGLVALGEHLLNERER